MDCSCLLLLEGGSVAARAAARELGVLIYELRWDANRKLHLVVAQQQGVGVSVPNASLLARAAASSSPLPSPLPADLALILHTSGTTSAPKAVPLTHRNLARTLTNVSATYRLRPEDVCMLVMPLFHVHGLMACLLSPLASGGCVVIPPKFSAATFWPEFARHGCTWYSAVPTIHQILLVHEAKQSSAQHRAKLKFIRSCSSALAAPTFKQIEAAFGVPVVEAYAMTEASHQMTSNNLPPAMRKAGSVGVGQGVQVRILDQQGKQMPQGKEGEICIKGENVTSGYLHNPSANASSYTADGFFRTGDQGFMDADGFVFITGRLKELINRGGEKISPLEIDAVLLAHKDVGEAIAFAKPDDMYGQEVAAAIVPKAAVWAALQAAGPVGAPARQAAEADLRRSVLQHAATKLSSFKLPKLLFFADQLPKTATGKIQRRNIAAHFLALPTPPIVSKL